MQALPMADHLKRHLLGVFLSATSYNPTVTINYMEKKGITGEVISQLFALAPTFKNSYERKLFILGLSHMLTAQSLPQSFATGLLEVLKQIIKMLNW
jgi:hypothetical protein